jgi:hypothetical protein
MAIPIARLQATVVFLRLAVLVTTTERDQPQTKNTFVPGAECLEDSPARR